MNCDMTLFDYDTVNKITYCINETWSIVFIDAQ